MKSADETGSALDFGTNVEHGPQPELRYQMQPYLLAGLGPFGQVAGRSDGRAEEGRFGSGHG